MASNGATDGNQEIVLRVLIADDEPEMRRSTRLMMSAVPNARVVAIARDGREAIALTREHMPDVALMDVNMPGLSGLEAIRRLREIRPDLVCIIISAEKDADTVREAVQVGVAAYLIKPFTVEELRAVLVKTRKVVAALRRRKAEQRRRQLEVKAAAYVKARRTDDQAVAVLEALAADPKCPLRWLTALAMLYVLRREWTKLKRLARYLERRSR